MNKLEIQSKIYHFDNDDNLYFVTVILVDEEPIADFSYYATSLTELKKSIEQKGNYFILTCWCGIPDCAGIDQGIQVIHSQNAVKWTIHQPKPNRTFIFPANDYKIIITEAIEQIKLDIANLWFTQVEEKNSKLEIVPRWEDDKALIKLLNINQFLP
ncbi:hypothetical protein VKI21_18605 [Cyanobacterium aponinum UTEX 3222]|uniref:Uncharacterized protein n=1 Tax=Cyanobacterium aponinum 0216 TaxID=2676140 RepID=A0A844GUL2_9CHRO|nr:hypothetical protein [Cyanobacterium aponinum]MBD2395164.1 hypothetical protein [Cyanobacterium aponinum FACHB-4101]MTF38559.1 hypothetical protein [Cyanobacterium aponinum 0216]WRL38427.1 hypothetical protein VKI22_17715 [Cyanobacterium aponinum UTEX 3221]WRL42020.1 hypothetical protein VKI21_18605 [Cyanobacterium aponinum UTEX 3222]